MRQQTPSDLFIALFPLSPLSQRIPQNSCDRLLWNYSLREIYSGSHVHSFLFWARPSLSDNVSPQTGSRLMLDPKRRCPPPPLSTTLPSAPLAPLKETTQIIYIFHSILGSLITWPSKPAPSVPFFSIMGACAAPSPPLTQPRPRHVWLTQTALTSSSSPIPSSLVLPASKSASFTFPQSSFGIFPSLGLFFKAAKAGKDDAKKEGRGRNIRTIHPSIQPSVHFPSR